MRTSIVVFLALAAFASATLSNSVSEWLLREQFDQFKEKYGKVYESEEEEEYRFSVFKTTVERIAMKNIEMEPIFGITKFADLTEEEFAAGFLTYRPSGVDPLFQVNTPRVASLADDFDWRDYNAVTPVKNQGYCGSCWAFSTTETIESAWYLAGNDLTEFSTAQIVQCDNIDAGCDGGDTITAYKYVKKAGGLATEEDYPYTASLYAGKTGSCSDDFTVSGGSISGYTYATTPCQSAKCKGQNETALAENLVSYQPVSICVDASTWSDYTGGIMSSKSCHSSYYLLDHCVQLVGYQNYNKAKPYWIVRNSWGDDWGESGYIYLKLGDNTCGVADEATQVTISS